MTTIDILIRPTGFALFAPAAATPSCICATSDELLAALAAKDTGAAICLYVAEELAFCSRFTLPLQTPKPAEAIRYQLAMLVPFPEQTFPYRYLMQRRGDQQEILLYAVQEHRILPLLEALAAAGHTLTGLFPEHQRHVTRAAPRTPWGLLLNSGPTAYFFTFNSKGRLTVRIPCHDLPTGRDMAALCGSEAIYHATEPTAPGLRPPAALLSKKARHRDFNLLPPPFRRPDYLRIVLAGLLCVNLGLLLLLGGLRLHRLYRLDQAMDREIAAIMPRVKIARELAAKKEQQEGGIAALTGIGSNPDLLGFLTALTAQLPPTSYLDQVRFDRRSRTYTVEGYAADIGGLTAALQGLGEVRLKSTSRRQNQTYFQLEITTP